MLVSRELALELEIDALGPPDRKRRASPERSIQKMCVQWLRMVLPGAEVMAIPNEQRGAGRTKEQRMRYGMARRASGILAGAPDLAIAIEGRTLWVELKAPGGVVSPAQQETHRRLRALNHTVLVADGLESLRLALHSAGIPLRESAGQPMRAARVRKAKPRARLPADPVPSFDPDADYSHLPPIGTERGW